MSRTFLNGITDPRSASAGKVYTSGAGGAGGWTNPIAPPWTASDNGLLTWTYDPALATAAVAPGSGTVYLSAVQLRVAATVSGVMLAQAGAGTSMTSGQNFLGLIDMSGTLQAVTADLSTTFTTANQLVNPNFTTPYAAPAGVYWIALLVNSTGTIPTFRTSMASTSASWSASVNANLTAATVRNGTNGSGKTSLTSITPSTNGTTGFMWWLALR